MAYLAWLAYLVHLATVDSWEFNMISGRILLRIRIRILARILAWTVLGPSSWGAAPPRPLGTWQALGM